ncbi:MAG: OsmC family protein [Microthrixaceae bacterium]|nr:OsmC family protein [Microthrixaceae bacterium]MCO5313964.1 OsmC family protein [Microthrixaceae bacterium]
MSEHTAAVDWERGDKPFGPDYDRTHVWTFDSGVTVPASSAPGLNGDPSRVDPEEALVAALAGCHMMWFLFLAQAEGLVVDYYSDDAVGTMERVDRGIQAITRIELRPTVEWSGDAPTADVVDRLHHEAHRRCNIANSIKAEVTISSR